MRELWLSRAEVAEATGWSDGHMRRKLRARPALRRGRNGKHVPEYAASSLPPEFQLELARLRLQGKGGVNGDGASPVSTSTDSQMALFAGAPPVAEQDRAALPPELLAEAERRLAVIAPLLDFRRRTNGHRPVIELPGGRKITTSDQMAAYLAAQHGMGRATIWSWYARFKKGGFAALGRRPRADKGRSHVFEENAAARSFIESKYLAERLSMRLAHQALCREWERLGGAPGAVPSYAAVRGYLRELPQPLAIIARDGERVFSEKCQPYLLTDFKALRPNQIWVSDHCKHDVWARNDCLPGAPRDSAVRIWLTAILDMRSRKLVGAVWCATPSSHSISSALRQAITSYGIPETFYIDNGKDYEKVGKIGLSDDCSGVLARLGIQPQFCLPKHPQSKLIESFFATLHKRFDALWRPFYCGSSPATRPEDCNAALKQHELWLRAKAKETPLPLASEFMETAQAWLVEHNAHHEHSGRGMDGRSPDEVFGELLPPAQRKTAEDPRALDSLFWDRQRRTVSEGGCVQLYNERYEPDPAAQANFARLFLEVGREILVACDPMNLGEALALDLDGRFLGMLRSQRLLARGPISHDDIRESMRLRSKVRKICTDYIRHIGAAGGQSEVEQIRRRAGLPLRLEAGDVASNVSTEERLPRAAGQGPAPYIEDVVDDVRELMRKEAD